MLEHVELIRRVDEAERAAPQQPQRGRNLAGAEVPGRCFRVAPSELQPQLRRLVDGLEEQLVAMDPLVGLLLEGEQPGRVQVPLVVAFALALEDWLRKVLVRRHGLSILTL